MANLKVYNASAGSGKTYKLTEEYLLLLFKNYQNKNYQNILAVTFTNKATDEMKTRIVARLHDLSISENADYAELLKEKFKFSASELKQVSKTILVDILHDYSRFNISTIDSFFQLIIRAFAREIGLQTGYNIELNEKRVLEKGVNILFKDLDNNPDLVQWLIEFSQSKIEEGKSWDLKREILKLSSQIFKEEFKSIDKELLSKIQDKKFIKSYLEKIEKVEKNFKTQIETLAKESIELIKKHNLTADDFKGKARGFVNHFDKVLKGEYLPTATVLKSVNNVDEWYVAKATNIADIQNVYNEGLNQKLSEIVNLYESEKFNFYSVRAIKKNIYTLAILADINAKVRDYIFENNLFLLSDGANLLSTVIGGDDTPFVYEKIGNIFKNFMIDEFQDTSTLQWDNFKRLIENSLAEAHKCLLVGDVKQAIYRWRNSDWNLLATQVGKEFEQNIDKQILSENWRSSKNVVEFNNEFFKNSSAILQNDYNKQNSLEDETILRAYENIIQRVPEKNQKTNGYLKFSFFQDKDWKEQAEKQTLELISDLLDKNYQQKDITILVRTKTDGKRIADVILQSNNSSDTEPVEVSKLHKVKLNVISDESLYLTNSSSIRLLISILKTIQNPNENFYKLSVLSEYLQYVKNDVELYQKILSLPNIKDFRDFLPTEFSSQYENLLRLPLYDLCEKLISIFELRKNKNELSYLLAFQGVVYDFENKENTDVSSFVNWWDEHGNTSTIKANENQNAIKILTIHKSKGLEFDVVIMPYLDWSVNPHKDHILWCETKNEPFSEISKLPIVFSKKLTDTIFADYYYDEQNKSYVDNLNLLYVAFTRAKKMLIGFSPLKKEIKNLETISDIVYSTISSSNGKFAENFDTENLKYEFGIFEEKTSKSEIENASISISDQTRDINIYESLRLKFSGEDFSISTENQTASVISHGNLMHYLFQNIRSANDLENALERLVFEGKINQNEKEILKNSVGEILQKEPFKTWFNESWKVLNERTILLKDGNTRRPDRVILNENETICIDYKFGKIERESYKQQLNDYASFLKKMDYKNIKSYIWYFNLEKVVEI